MPATSARAPTSLQLLAPAKLNLFLHITGRRADGYHELQTVFQLLDYGDPMHFKLDDSRAGAVAFHLHAAGLPTALPMEQNLVLRAAHLLRHQADKPVAGVQIELTKRIPAGAGLGGGSANAAMTLLALNQLWNLQIDVDGLCQLGLQLGADVPVFIRGRSAWAEGVGERLTAIDLEGVWYLVICPPCMVSTAKIFCHEDLTRNTPAIKMADFLAGGVRNARNDCTPITSREYPDVARALNWLGEFAAARMTGTGASVFATFTDEASARAVLKKMPDGWHGFVAQGVNSLAHSVVDK